MWYDSRSPSKLWFVRNNERPMHLARTKDKRSIIMASEAGMLQWLVDKHGIGIEEVFSLDEGYLMSIDFTEQHLTIEVEDKIEDAWDGWKNYKGRYTQTSNNSTTTSSYTYDYYADT